MISEDSNLNEEINLISIWYLILRKRYLISLITSLSIVGSIIYAISLKRTWSGNFQIVLKRDEDTFLKRSSLNIRNTADIFSTLTESAGSSGLETQIEILKSPSVLMPIFEFVKKEYANNGENINDISYRKWFNQSFKMDIAKRSEVLELEYRDQNKEIILPVLEKISSTYKQYSGKTKLKSLTSGINYLDEQIKIYKIKQLQSLQDLQDFAYANDLLIKSPLNSENVSEVLNVEQVRVNEANKIRIIDKYLKKIDDISEDPESLMYFTTIFPEFSNNQIRVATQNINKNIAIAKANFLPGDEEISRLENELKNIVPVLKKELINFLNAKRYEAEANLEASKREKKILAKYKQLLSNASMDEKTLEGLILEKRTLSLQKAKTSDPWDLITQPTLTNYPVAPSRKKITIIGAILGSISSIIVAIVLEKIKGIIFKEEEVQGIIKIPKIRSFDISNVESWSTGIELLSKSNIFKNKNSISFLQVGFVEDFLVKEFKSLSKKLLFKFNISYTSNLNDALGCDDIILIIQIGKICSKDLEQIKEDLRNQKNNLIGIIFFK
mgnify:CR=1 FL=1